MKDWREMYMDRFSKAESEQEIFDRLSQTSTELGFEYCSYGIRLPLPVSRPRFSLFCNYSQQWIEQYTNNNYFDIDPSVQHGLTRQTPIVWQANTADGNTEFWSEAQQHKLRHGWCMPARGGRGVPGMVSFVRSNEIIGNAELADKEGKMVWVVNLVHSLMNQYLVPKYMPECEVQLTPREREALKWSATGKTYIEIGTILAIDERTIKYHLVNAMRKLNAANRTEAAIKASVLEMLF